MVKHLAEFDGVDGVSVAAKILRPIGRLAHGQDSIDRAGKSVLEYFGELMQTAPEDVYELMAVLSEEDPKTYTCNGGEALLNLSIMISDPDLISFFGLRRRTRESSGSAPEITEAPETSAVSSDTARSGTVKK